MERLVVYTQAIKAKKAVAKISNLTCPQSARPEIKMPESLAPNVLKKIQKIADLADESVKAPMRKTQKGFVSLKKSASQNCSN